MSEFAEKVLTDAFTQQLVPLLTQASWDFEPEIGNYWYRINFSFDYGYTLHRRLKPDQEIKFKSIFWNRSSEVEDWIQLDGGMFYSSFACRPIFHFSSFEEAKNILVENLKK